MSGAAPRRRIELTSAENPLVVGNSTGRFKSRFITVRVNGSEIKTSSEAHTLAGPAKTEVRREYHVR